MATARPFRAIRYDPRRAGDPADLTTPPFDVISPAAQRRYYERHPYNFIRLDLGLDAPGDDEATNKYTRAAALLQEWLRAGILIREEAPALYVYRQTFKHGGAVRRRTGVLVSLRLEDYTAGVVLPHERTRKADKEDRLRLTRATRANLSPVFSLAADGGRLAPPLAAATTGPPLYDFEDEAGERHELWAVREPERIAGLLDAVAPARLYIADGHHRYETALAYRDERRAAGAGPEAGSEYVLMDLVPVDNPGLVIEATHRLLRDGDGEMRAALDGLGEDFEVTARPVAGPEEAAALWAETPAATADLALLLPEQRALQLLRLRDPGRMAAAAPERSAAWRGLSVAILERLVLAQRLGVTAERLTAGEVVGYEHDAAVAARAVWRGEARAAFLVHPPAVADIVAVCDAGEVMPQKSTFFYPKLRSGLVIHPLDD